MTGRIIPIHGEDHASMQLLLPWYVTGQLDPVEHAQVEAHLAGCPECQAELRSERRLAEEVAELPVSVDNGWEELRRRIEHAAPSRPPRRKPGRWLWQLTAAGGAFAGWRADAPWLKLAVAAQFGLLLALGGALLLQTSRPAAYHTLGAARTGPAGDIVVIFRPEATEHQMRRVLDSASAYIVDGPTPAGAYVLRTAAAERPSALAKLRSSPQIELAQPVDSASPP